MRGFGRVDAVVLLLVLFVLAGLIVTLMPGDPAPSHIGTECMYNVREIANALALMDANRAPQLDHTGTALAALLESDVHRRDGGWEILRCPVDPSDAEVSYASRDLEDKACASRRVRPLALIADDSIDHHRTGLVVGYTDGSVKFREYPPDTVVGQESKISWLRCLRKD